MRLFLVLPPTELARYTSFALGLYPGSVPGGKTILYYYMEVHGLLDKDLTRWV